MRPHRPPATRRKLVFMCGAIPVFLTVVLAVYRPSFFGRLDDSTYDIVMRSSRRTPAGSRVVIVDVDERSLATVGQWPWRRDRVAALIDSLRKAGASVVALDIVFAESDRYESAGRPDPPNVAAAVVPGSASGAATSDDALAATLREGRVILGYALTFDPGAQSAVGRCTMHPIGLAIVHPAEDTGDFPYFRAAGAVCNLPVLAQAARASGFLNAAPDADGILRRVPLLAELNGRIYPSLALASVSAATGAKDMTLRVANVNAASLSFDRMVVPLDGKSNLLVRYRGKKRTFPYLSAADALSGQLAPDAVRGKIVFVGTTALGTREVVATPLDTLFAGVEVQATVADNLLQQSFFRRSPVASIVESLSVLAVGLLVASLATATGMLSGLVAASVALAALWWGAASLLSSSGLFLSPLYPTLGVISTLITLMFAKVTIEHRRAESAGREKTAAQRLMVQTLLSLTETRDKETGKHSRRTQRYARVLAEQLATHPNYREYLTPERIDLLSSLAPLHDIGKVGIPDHILNKPGALTVEERAEMRKHPVLGRDVILKAEQQVGVRDDVTLAMAKDIVYTHHERWDGTGYPQGLRSNQIPIPGRVMAIVDVYDATVTRSLYRTPMSHEEAVEFIVQGKGTHFDPAVVEAFLRVATELHEVAVEEGH